MQPAGWMQVVEPHVGGVWVFGLTPSARPNPRPGATHLAYSTGGAPSDWPWALALDQAMLKSAHRASPAGRHMQCMLMLALHGVQCARPTQPHLCHATCTSLGACYACGTWGQHRACAAHSAWAGPSTAHSTGGLERELPAVSCPVHVPDSMC